MLNFSEIRVFTASAEAGSFSKAAQQLHLSQPAVSQQIRSLEYSLRTQLFQRSSQGVALTNAGRILLPMARELLDLSRRIQETMGSLEGQIIAHLTIGCTTTTGKVMLPLVVAAFNRERSDVQVTIEMRNCDSVENALLAGNIHLGVSAVEVVHPDIECQSFFTDQVILVAPAGHPFTHRSSVQPTELIDQPFILEQENCSTRLIVKEELARQGISLDRLQVVMVAESAEAIVMAVEQKLGLAFVPRLAARHGLQTGHFVKVPVEGLLLERPLYMARSSHYSKMAARNQF